MKKLTFLIIAVLFFLATNFYGQELINALEITSLNININGDDVMNKSTDGRMLIPYNPTEIKLFQNDNFAYWVAFKYKQCGKKVKLTSNTFVETKDGDVINGSSAKMKHSIEDDQPTWFIAYTRDTIEIKNDSKLTFIAGFDYDMRSSN